MAAYVPLRTEPGSIELLDELVQQGVRVIVPVAAAGQRPRLGAVPGRRQPLGADAIAAVDAVLVPALAVAADGTRLGRGGGSYDRALARARGRSAVAALLFDGETARALPLSRGTCP